MEFRRWGREAVPASKKQGGEWSCLWYLAVELLRGQASSVSILPRADRLVNPAIDTPPRAWYTGFAFIIAFITADVPRMEPARSRAGDQGGEKMNNSMQPARSKELSLQRRLFASR